MKKIKYIIFGFFVFISFLNITYAKAQNANILNGGGYSSYIYLPSQAQFYDLTSVNTGYKVSTACYADQCYADEFFVGSSQWGGAVSFDTDTLFMPNYLYSLSVYIGYDDGSGSCGNWPYFNSYTPRLTVCTDILCTYEKFNTNTASNIISYAHSFGAFQVETNESGSTMCSGRLTFLFVPQTGGNSVFVPYLSTGTISNWRLFGYKAEAYGKYSDMDTADLDGLKNSLQSSIDNNATIITNNINSSIANSTNSINNTIIEKENETQQKVDKIDDSINSEDDDTSSKKCGVICKLKGIFTGIIELPKKLVTLLIDALKSLFVPTDEQLQEIIDDSSKLSENLGFVGESIDFFINLFTSLLSMAGQEGCITLPEFTVGKTSLFDAHTFWNEQRYCLSSNEFLSKNIETIRTVTSIVMVSFVVVYFSKAYWTVMSKKSSENGVTE